MDRKLAQIGDGGVGVQVELHQNGRRYRVTRYFGDDGAAQVWLRKQQERVTFVRLVGYVRP